MSINGKGGSAPDEEKEDSPQDDKSSETPKGKPKSHGFHVIDQGNRNNILLAEMVRGQLMMKQSCKIATVQFYTRLVFGEIDVQIEDLAKSSTNELSVPMLKKAKKDIQLYVNTYRKKSRGAKNILRVMVSAPYIVKHSVCETSCP